MVDFRFKMSIEASGHDASINRFGIVEIQKLKTKKTT